MSSKPVTKQFLTQNILLYSWYA